MPAMDLRQGLTEMRNAWYETLKGSTPVLPLSIEPRGLVDADRDQIVRRRQLARDRGFIVP